MNPLSRAPTAATQGVKQQPADQGTPSALAQELSGRLREVRAALASGGGAADQAAALDALEARAVGEVEVHLRPENRTVRQIRGESLQSPGRGGGAAVDDEGVARAFLRENRALLRLLDPDDEMEMVGEQTDSLGRRQVRFAQRYKGLPVWPGEIIVHLDGRRAVDCLDGAYAATPSGVPLQPEIDAEEAVKRARAEVPGGEGGQASDPELIIHAPVDRTARLAWKLEITVSIASRWAVVIDARSGQVLSAFDTVMRQNVRGSGVDVGGVTRDINVWQEGGTFFVVDTSKMMYDPSSDPPSPDTTRGGIVILDAQNQEPDQQGRLNLSQVTSNNPNSWAVADAVSASFGLSETYDYYLERHGRNSLDGQGGTMLGVVRFGRDFQNAFWNSTLMVFGDGAPFADALDVVAHELTHGVTEKTANLVYENQSGALNEAMSDVFGESVEARTLGAPDWLTGAKLGQALRNMMDPGALEVCSGCGRNYPSTMSEFIAPNDPFLDPFEGRDNGGVHINSSIINRAFYLLAEGLAGAIGIEPAADIFYRALTAHLVKNSQFVDARLAAIASAEELFGGGSIEAQKTAEAFDGVEIFADQGTPPPPSFPPVAGIDSTIFAFVDPDSGGLFLGRREGGDSEFGVPLSSFDIAPSRPAVVGDGSLALFVDSVNDICLIPTGGGAEEECLGFPGQVASVAVTADASLVAFVLRDESGEPENRITVIDTVTEEATTFPLRPPAFDGGGGFNTVLFADAMDFTADGRFLVYDALNATQLSGGATVALWSIYALDLVNDTTLTIIPPTEGLDIGFPALSQASDNFIAFDAFDQQQGRSMVTVGNLNTGELVAIDAVAGGFGVPGFTGDDRALVYSQSDAEAATGFSLLRQSLAADGISPSGSPALWLRDGDFGVIYRRGTFTGPQPTATPTRLPTATRTVPVTLTRTSTATRAATSTPTPTAPLTGVPTTTSTRASTPTRPVAGPPTHTRTAAPTRTPGGTSCSGDCNGDGSVAINEIILGVNIGLGTAAVASCASFDRNDDAQVAINEIIAAVNQGLFGCDFDPAGSS